MLVLPVEVTVRAFIAGAGFPVSPRFRAGNEGGDVEVFPGMGEVVVVG